MNGGTNKQQGFTLVEMAIVLTIIGLIIGGILAGADLIQSSRVNATISQLKNITVNVYTFQDKYTYLPGDYPDANTTLNVTEGGRAENTDAPMDGNGDGDGVIEDMNEYSLVSNMTASYFNNELPLVFRHLTAADLPVGTAPIMDQLPGLVAGVDYPLTKLNTGGIATFTVGSELANFIGWEGNAIFNGSTNERARFGQTNFMFTPEIAYSIDSKLDDGLPQSGQARAIEKNCSAVGEFHIHACMNIDKKCVNLNGVGDESISYNLTSVTTSCSLTIKM